MELSYIKYNTILFNILIKFTFIRYCEVVPLKNYCDSFYMTTGEIRSKATLVLAL